MSRVIGSVAVMTALAVAGAATWAQPLGAAAEEARLRAELDRAKAEVEQSRLDLRRAEALMPQRAISQEDYEGIRAHCKRAEARLGVAEARLKLAKGGGPSDDPTAPRKEEVELARAEVKAAEAEEEAARNDADRARQLLPTRAISQAEYDRAVGGHELARRRTATMQARVKLIEAGGRSLDPTKPRPEELGVLRAELGEAKAEEALARGDAERMEQLLPLRAVTRQECEKAQERYRHARQRVADLTERLRRPGP
jgi:multidrug resistance efflux pump